MPDKLVDRPQLLAVELKLYQAPPPSRSPADELPLNDSLLPAYTKHKPKPEIVQNL